MDTAITPMGVNIPTADLRFFKQMAKRMGWDTYKIKTSTPKSTVQTPDPTLMTEEEFMAKIDRAKAEVAQGKSYRCNTRQEAHDFINSL